MSMDVPGKNTGVGCHSRSPGDLPGLGTESMSLASPALAGRFSTIPPRKPQHHLQHPSKYDSPSGPEHKNWGDGVNNTNDCDAARTFLDQQSLQQIGFVE